jgi:hypothetical protein
MSCFPLPMLLYLLLLQPLIFSPFCTVIVVSVLTSFFYYFVLLLDLLFSAPLLLLG